MDRQNKTDRFFRENLDQIEIIPSANAWKEIQQNIGSHRNNRSALYMKIAAAVVILLACTLLFYPTKEGNQPTISEVSHPIPLQLSTPEIPADTETMVAQQMPATQKIKEEQPAKVEDKTQQEIKTETTIQVATIRQVNLSADLAPKINLKKSPDNKANQPAVRITYIASEKEVEVDTVKLNLFNKMWNIAQHTSPSDIITGLREAKDGLIENGFKRN